MTTNNLKKDNLQKGKIIKIHKISDIVHQLQRGNVVCMATDTVYGLLADATNDIAVKKIYQFKQRSIKKALPLFCHSVKQMQELTEIPQNAQIIIKEFCPGPLTVILELKHKNTKFSIKNTKKADSSTNKVKHPTTLKNISPLLITYKNIQKIQKRNHKYPIKESVKATHLQNNSYNQLEKNQKYNTKKNKKNYDASSYTVAIRIPNSKIIIKALTMLDRVVAATSANISNAQNPQSMQDLIIQLEIMLQNKSENIYLFCNKEKRSVKILPEKTIKECGKKDIKLQTKNETQTKQDSTNNKKSQASTIIEFTQKIKQNNALENHITPSVEVIIHREGPITHKQIVDLLSQQQQRNTKSSKIQINTISSN